MNPTQTADTPTLGTLEERARRRTGAFGEDALIVCDSLVRIYQSEGIEVQALQGLDLLVEEGELVAIVGASGSGKSTLLSVLSGLDVPTAGRVRVGPWDLMSMTAKQRVAYRRSMVGFVWQQTARNVVPYLTAVENVEFPQALAGVRARTRRTRAAELLDVLGVGYCAQRRPAQMSGGEQQRVAIAVALANRPRVLFADEPTGELDTATSHDVLEGLRTVNRELGTTVVVVTHDSGVSEHVQRTVAIRDGRTSSEVVRRTRTADDGTEHVVAEEFAVLDRAGRVQLPREYREALDLVGKVRLALETSHVSVWPDRDPSPTSPQEEL
ncbi:ABC transporter ATP-binding protein [Cellulomonas fimi]|uniref:ABC transporter related protein n=1 Tax=Cellulomonas fimi (strain ATCC 484 / DSM 20113 / JCM 1341 / CCUG 24087 / LMG 16345 / NBRC 15513 / NCIMB 8980 / NCTC 7547 / NRS-133) TaxID=590998 RepID=F4H8Q1_CELFA|nr:ABC transporter related protein [Cellulomonas fimi ATCC 484]NNH07369.1 ABC transporter ATP-binding protein [Cellulomonas fimi]VEH34998.1 Lipoprotein-releasing system ATP-binding protein LolD [Cellulomonas fimi]